MRRPGGRTRPAGAASLLLAAGELVGDVVGLVLGLLHALLHRRGGLVRLALIPEVLVTGGGTGGLLGASLELLRLALELVLDTHRVPPLCTDLTSDGSSFLAPPTVVPGAAASRQRIRRAGRWSCGGPAAHARDRPPSGSVPRSGEACRTSRGADGGVPSAVAPPDANVRAVGFLAPPSRGTTAAVSGVRRGRRPASNASRRAARESPPNRIRR